MHSLKPYRTRLKSIVCGVTLTAVLPVTAQTLYQVEVIVFASNNTSAETEETWPQDKLLSYPDNIIALLPENTGAVSTAINTQASTTDSSANTSNLSSDNSLTGITPTTQPPVSYTELSLQKKMLTDWRDRMRSSGQYRILSHTSWLQPATGSEAGKAVVITGGNQYGEHYELEGSIQIRGNSSPFKVVSHLWLSQFLPGGDSEATPIQLPALPKPPLSAISSETMSVATDTVTDTVTKTEPEVIPSGAAENVATNSAPLYAIKRIITHQSEDNLMPDKPLYLDHPILGILVKISEYKPDKIAIPSS